ncbi:MAG: glutathione S-transferase family protein [Myxococcota bacterium]
MKIYQTKRCPFAHRARIVLEEKKLEYTVEYFEPKQRPSELARVSADARSPTIFDAENGTWVWDSMVVAEYLDERYREPPLLPSDAGARAHARLMIREVDAKFGPVSGHLVEEFVHKEPAERDLGRAEHDLPRIHEALVAWEARLERREFLASDVFTLADVALYTPIFALVGLVGADRAIASTLPRLRAWRERVAARPSTAY